MRKLYSLTASLLLFFVSFSQELPGFRAGNYAGVNSVFFNPANIVDSRFRYDFNLLTFSSSIGNNKASFNLNDITTAFDTENLINQLFSSTGGFSSAMGNVDLRGPSLMFNTGQKMSIALTTRARAMVNVIDFDGGLGKQLMDDSDDDIQLPYSISSNADMQFKANAWTELGFSVARVLSNKEKNFFKAGVTLKYLNGAGNGYLNISQLKSTLNEDAMGDVYLSNSTGRIALGFGGIQLGEDFEPADFTQFNNTGFGADIGLVYEHRPEYDKMQEDGKPLNSRNKYKYKIGAALLDLGRIRYQKDMQRSGAYTIDITGNERFYLKDMEEIDGFNDVFKSRPQYFTPASSNTEASYKVSLPSTLQLEFDYYIKGNIYANLAAQLPLSGTSEFNPRNYTSFTITPRYEGKGIGLNLPINYNSLTDFNAGISFRLGPLFIGSGSVLTALMGSSKQADVHVGLHIAGLRK